MRFLLDALSSDLNRVRYSARYESTETEEDALPPCQKSNVYWGKSFHRCNSIVSDLFEGQLMSSIRCWKCGHVSVTFDVFMDLSLPLPKRPPSGLKASAREWLRKDRSTSGELLSHGVSAQSGTEGMISLFDCFNEFANEEELDKNEWYNCPK
jgi:ubiquitin C-terminal hydrolase